MSRGHQVARSWLIASSATGFGAISHLLAGGHLPHPLVLALATSLAALLTLSLTRLKLPRASLGLGVIAGQGILHTLYSHGQPLAPAFTGHGHHHGSEPLLGAVPLEQLAHSGPAMWVGHALAAAITFTLLAYGESLLLVLRALLGYVRARLEPVRVRPLTLPPALPVAFAPAHLVSLLAGFCRAPRGPPALA